MSEHEVLCFHCGQPVGDPPQVNLIDGEEPCPACAERLLDMLPAIFHTPFEPVEEVQESTSAEEAVHGDGDARTEDESSYGPGDSGPEPA